MKFSQTESFLLNLGEPYTMTKNEILKLRSYGFDLEKLRRKTQNHGRIAALAKLFIHDHEHDKKVDFDLLMRDEIPTETILRFSRHNEYIHLPHDLHKLYNNIVNRETEPVVKKFLKNMIFNEDLNVNMIIEDAFDHIKEKHLNTEYENKRRVISEQKPGVNFILTDEAGETSLTDTVFNDYMRELLIANVDKILEWIRSQNSFYFEQTGGDSKEIYLKFDIRQSKHFDKKDEKTHFIGRGYDLLLNEKKTPIIKMAIKKDRHAPLGFKTKTIFPDVLDKSSKFTGIKVSLEEANEIALSNAIEKTLIKARNEVGRELEDYEIAGIKKRLERDFYRLDYIDSPFYKAYSKIKEDCSDKKIVVFFGKFQDKLRIEITPETAYARKNNEYHRCIIFLNNEKNTITTSFFQTEFAKGYDVKNKIDFADLSEDEQKLFNNYIKIVEKELNNKKTSKRSKSVER